jgi:FkbM family methyltransferase
MIGGSRAAVYAAHERWIRTRATRAGLVELRGHTFYAPAIGAGSVVVDLGANRGEFSAALAASFGCRCYAVEASPVLYVALPDSPLISKFNCAIAASDGERALYLSDNPEAGSTNSRFAEAWGARGRVVVKAVRLDTFLRSQGIEDVDLLKCDIEGSELEVFSSLADETISRVRQFSVEFHDFIDPAQASAVARIRTRLATLGFFQVTPSMPYGNQNVLFLNRARVTLSGRTLLRLHLYKHVSLRSRCMRESLLRVLRKALPQSQQSPPSHPDGPPDGDRQE